MHFGKTVIDFEGSFICVQKASSTQKWKQYSVGWTYQPSQRRQGALPKLLTRKSITFAEIRNCWRQLQILVCYVLFRCLAVRQKKRCIVAPSTFAGAKEKVRGMFYQKESNLAWPCREHYCLVSIAQPRQQGTWVSSLALPLTCMALGKLSNLGSLFTPPKKKFRMIIGIRRQFINALINRRQDARDGAVLIHPGSQTTPVLSAPLQGLPHPSPRDPSNRAEGSNGARRESSLSICTCPFSWTEGAGRRAQLSLSTKSPSHEASWAEIYFCCHLNEGYRQSWGRLDQGQRVQAPCLEQGGNSICVQTQRKHFKPCLQDGCQGPILEGAEHAPAREGYDCTL